MSSAQLPPVKGAIFDCDGTLLSSLGAWQGLQNTLADAAGITVTDEERALFTTFTIPEVAAYFHAAHALGETSAQVEDMIDGYMMHYYQHEATLLPGVEDFLRECVQAGVVMAVCSSSKPAYLEAGLESSGIRSYFKAVVSVDDVASTKRERLVFDYTCSLLGTSKEVTWGFEDSLYAMSTLYRAGYPVVGLYDETWGVSRSEVERTATVAIQSFTELSVDTDGNLRQQNCG